MLRSREERQAPRTGTNHTGVRRQNGKNERSNIHGIRFFLFVTELPGTNQKALKAPENTTLPGFPPYITEMNPTEQIRKLLRSMGFKHEVFETLNPVVDRLCNMICRLANGMVRSIACRQWMMDAFLDGAGYECSQCGMIRSAFPNPNSHVPFAAVGPCKVWNGDHAARGQLGT